MTDVQWNFGKYVVGSVVSHPGTMWWGWTATPAIQEWSVEGEFLRDFEGELPWFPKIFEMPNRSRDPPETRLTGLALEADDNLWMTVMTADPEWDEVPLVQTRIGFAISPGHDDDYFDTRLDVFKPARAPSPRAVCVGPNGRQPAGPRRRASGVSLGVRQRDGSADRCLRCADWGAVGIASGDAGRDKRACQVLHRCLEVAARLLGWPKWKGVRHSGATPKCPPAPGN